MKPLAYAMSAGAAFVTFEVWFWSRMQAIMQLIYAGNSPLDIIRIASSEVRVQIAITLIGSAFLVGLMLYLAARSIASMMKEVAR